LIRAAKRVAKKIDLKGKGLILSFEKYQQQEKYIQEKIFFEKKEA